MVLLKGKSMAQLNKHMMQINLFVLLDWGNSTGIRLFFSEGLV